MGIKILYYEKSVAPLREMLQVSYATTPARCERGESELFSQTHLRTLSLFRKAASAVTIDERLRVLLNTSAAVLSWTLVASYEHASLYFMLPYRFF